MDVDSCNVFGKIPLLANFTMIWILESSCVFFFLPLLLLQTESYLKAPIFFFILKPFLVAHPALILPWVRRFRKLCKTGHKSERKKTLGQDSAPLGWVDGASYLNCSDTNLQWQSIFQLIKFVDCSYLLYWPLSANPLGFVASLAIYKAFPKVPGL